MRDYPTHEIDTIPIAEYLISELGYRVVKRKDCRSWRVLESSSGHRVLACGRKAHNGKYIYIDVQSGKTRNLSHLLDELGIPFREPKKKFSEFVHVSEKNNVSCAEELHLKVRNVLEKHVNCSGMSFLAFRDISLSIDDLNPILNGAKSVEEMALFPLFLSKKLIKDRGARKGVAVPQKSEYLPKRLMTAWAQYSLPSLHQSRMLILPSGGKRGVSILGNEKGDVFLFESPIDALSLHEIKLRRTGLVDGTYFSSCGNLTRWQLENMCCFLEDRKNFRVFACFDSDETGERFFRMSEEVFGRLLGKRVLRFPPPQEKDWNDYLSIFKKTG